MKKYYLSLLLLLTIGKVFSQEEATIAIHINPSKQVISKHIYGHFSEHLGRCIYGGFWVSPDLNVPKQGQQRMAKKYSL